MDGNLHNNCQSYYCQHYKIDLGHTVEKSGCATYLVVAMSDADAV